MTSYIFIFRTDCKFVPRCSNRGLCFRGWSIGAGWPRYNLKNIYILNSATVPPLHNDVSWFSINTPYRSIIRHHSCPSIIPNCKMKCTGNWQLLENKFSDKVLYCQGDEKLALNEMDTVDAFCSVSLIGCNCPGKAFLFVSLFCLSALVLSVLISICSLQVCAALMSLISWGTSSRLC